MAKTNIAVSAARSITDWSLLEHFYESDPTAPGNTDPKNPKPLDPVKPLALAPSAYAAISMTVDTAQEDPKLQALVKKHVLDVRPEFGGMRFALADLSKSGKPAYAGNNLPGPHGDSYNMRTEMTFAASLAKIVAMLAAYQLMYDLNALAKIKNLTTREELFEAAWNGWAATQDPAGQPFKDMAPGSILQTQARLIMKNKKGFRLKFGYWDKTTTWTRKIKGKLVPFVDGAPNLDNIFDVVAGSPAKVQFKQSADPEDGGQAMGGRGSPTGQAFYDRLYATIDSSNDATSASVIADLGYLFINSVLIQSGLWSPLVGGFFLAAPYEVVGKAAKWIQNPLPQHDEKKDGEPNTTRRYQIASPVAAIALCALLGRGRLVSPHASQEMLYLMNKTKFTVDPTGKSGTWSPLLDSVTRTLTTKCSKLGLQKSVPPKVTDIGDAAYTERKSHSGKPLKYVAALVDWRVTDANWQSTDLQILIDLANGLDQAIEENNP